MTSPTKRTNHHYLPRSYLAFFSEDDRIATVDRVTGEWRRTDPANTAKEKDFYTFKDSEGNASEDLENAFSSIEGDAKSIIANMNSGFRLMPRFEQRDTLSAFVALQAIRTPEHRKAYEVKAEHISKMVFRMSTDGRGRVIDSLKQSGQEVTEANIDALTHVSENLENFDFAISRNEILSSMLDLWEPATAMISGRRWQMFCFDKPALITSDHPVILIAPPAQPAFLGTGFGTAAEILFPLTPKRLLVMSEFDRYARGDPGEILDGSPDIAAMVNARLIHGSYLEYFVPPTLLPTLNIQPLGNRPVAQVSGGPFRELNAMVNAPQRQPRPRRFRR